MNLLANTGLPGLDWAIAVLRSNGIAVYMSTVRSGYIVTDTREGGSTRDGVPYIDIINQANSLTSKTKESQ